MKENNKFTDDKVLSLLRQKENFENCREMCEYLGFEYNSHSYLNYKRLSMYCNWHKIGERKIIIDNVFNERKILPKRIYTNYKFKYNINDIIKQKTGEFIILDRYIKKWNECHSCKTYLCKCLKDNYEFELREHHINQGIGCPVCGNKKPILGINTIYDLRKDLLKYIVNEKDAKENKIYSTKKILCKCPFCGHEKYVIINNLTRVGFSCEMCSDHISYPNKFIREFFNQLGIEYRPEMSFEWSNGKLYDFYVHDKSMIIEAHGLQHYEDSHFAMIGGRTLEEEQENDKFKEQIAKENKIENYIVLDCRKSTLEWIKNSIMNSILPEKLNFNEYNINWNKCHEFALKPMIKIVCDKWNESKTKVISDIAEYFNMDKHTVSDYLDKGTKLNWCKYEKGNKYYSHKATGMAKSKPIYCHELNIYFRTRYECDDYFKKYLNNEKFNSKYLYKYINKNKKYYNYLFSYITVDEYNKFLDNEKYKNKIYENINKEGN